MMKLMQRVCAGLLLSAVAIVAQAEAPLTDERIDNLLNAMSELQPVMAQVGQRLESLPAEDQPPRLDPRDEDFDPEAMAEGMVDALEKVDAYGDVKRVANNAGFDSAEELLEVQARVMMGFLAATQEAMMNNPNLPEEARKQMQKQLGGIGKKVSENDKKVLEQNQQKIMKYMQAQQQSAPQ
jgi:hypothetical protein